MSHRRQNALGLFLILICCALFYSASDFQSHGSHVRSPWILREAYIPGYGPQLGWRAELHDNGSGFLEQDSSATPAPDAFRRRTEFKLAPESLAKLKGVLEQQRFGSLQAEYSAKVTDQPSRLLDLHSPDLNKSVRVEATSDDIETARFQTVWANVIPLLPAVSDS